MKKYSSVLHNTLPFVIMITYTFIYIEIFSYVGFLRHFFLVDSRFFVFAAIGMIAIDVYYGYNVRNRKNNSPNDLVYRLSNLFLSVQIVIYLILKMVEGAHYNNYIYSTYHLQPDNMINGIVFGISIAILYRAMGTKKYLRLVSFRSLHNNKGLVELIFLSILLSLSLVLNGLTTIKNAIGNDIYILTHVDASYDEKMEAAWGFYYDYMKFVSEYVTPESVILAPPQEEPWLTVGNAGLDRYFVYPAYVINGEFNTLNNNDKKYQYILIAHGDALVADSSRYGWPKVSIKAEKIWYYDPITKKTSEVDNKTYYPNDKINNGAWGLIKIKND